MGDCACVFMSKMAHITSVNMSLTRALEERSIKECVYILKSLLLPAVSYIRYLLKEKNCV